MKQLLLFCFAFASLAGCKKKSDPPPPPFQSYFRMTIDGTRNITATEKIYASTPRSTTRLSMYGHWPPGYLDITLNNPALGERIISSNTNSPTFVLSDPPALSSFYAGHHGLSNGVTGSGKINMLEISDAYVKGTFEFIGSHTNANGTQIRTVTNGEFHIKRVP